MANHPTSRAVRGGLGFHSRLQISADGHNLLSAGWVWHPVDMLVEFAAFDRAEHVLVMGNADGEPIDEDTDALGPGQLGRWSLPDTHWETRVNLAEPPGILPSCA